MSWDNPNDNLPPGTWGGDPRAPWNAPDPWEGRECGDCRHCRLTKMLDGSETHDCVHPENDCAYEIDPKAPACEAFEERGW